MDLIRINEVVENYKISSRTLRYYEEAGLLWSSRPDNKSQRYYDAGALERLKQIIILRKLQIPVKDIIKIYKSDDTAALIQAFVYKLDSLDAEITALSELRRLVDEFLQKMLTSGFKKISAITLLYEETEKRLTRAGGPTNPGHLTPDVRVDGLSTVGQPDPDARAGGPNTMVTFGELSEISRAALRLSDVRLIRLPPARVLTSRLKAGGADGIDENLFIRYGLTPEPGFRNCFFKKEPDGEWVMLIKLPDNYANDTEYLDEAFPGGLYAITSSFMADIDDAFALLKDWINISDEYELDTGGGREPPRYEMIEEILPFDIANKFNRYQQDVFVPVKLRER